MPYFKTASVYADIDNYLRWEDRLEHVAPACRCCGQEVEDADDLSYGYCSECIAESIAAAADIIGGDKFFLEWLDGLQYSDMPTAKQQALVRDYAIDNPDYYIRFCEKEQLL